MQGQPVFAPEHQSFWIASAPGPEYGILTPGTSVDVTVIGGGIVGITAAYLLKEAGLTVAVIESDRILSGVTGHTTAKVTSLHRVIYKYLIDHVGIEKARQYAEANQTAIEKIRSLVDGLDIDCDMRLMPAYTYALSDETRKIAEDEAAAATQLGLPARFTEDVPMPFKTMGAVRFLDQVQFHPRKYLLSLASRIPGNGCAIHEHTRALNIEEGEWLTITTDKGDLKSRDAIIATHYPFYDQPGMYYARMYPSSSYVLGVTITEPFPDGMFIGVEEDSLSYRSQQDGDRQLVIVVDEGHRTGEGVNTTERYNRLFRRAGRDYHVQTVDYYWMTHDNMTVDRIPYIGRLTGDRDRLYVATGFEKWGMTNGTAAAMILADLIQGKQNPWQPVFDPSRFDTEKARASHVMAVGWQMSHPSPPEEDPERLKPGEGKLVQVRGKKVAAYHGEDGEVYVLSHHCTHMGCTVSWNAAEKTWDCPCHGSRFSYTGSVIHDPAVKPLPQEETG